MARTFAFVHSHRLLTVAAGLLLFIVGPFRCSAE